MKRKAVLNRIVSGMLAVVVAAGSSVLPIWAEENVQTYVTQSYSASYIKNVRQDLTEAMEKFEAMLEGQYQSAEESLKQDIINNGWDYEYTMQSFYEQGNPFANTDYTSLIAAYATVIEAGKETGKVLYDVPFLTVNKDVKDVPEKDGRKCAEITFDALDSDALFDYYGYSLEDNEAVSSAYEERIKLLNDILDGAVLSQSVFVKTIEQVQSKETDLNTFLAEVPEGLTRARSNIVQTALSLIGQVPYEWGGKPSKAGYDTSWWTFDDNGQQKGLDCSGFVQWTYLTAGYPSEVTNKLGYTGTIASELEPISEKDLQPGDIGLMNETQSSMNHTGIYIGNGLWIHCSSSADTVVVNNGCFKYYRKAPIDDTDINSSEMDDDALLARIREIKDSLPGGVSASDMERDVQVNSNDEAESEEAFDVSESVSVSQAISDAGPNSHSDTMIEFGDEKQEAESAEITAESDSPDKIDDNNENQYTLNNYTIKTRIKEETDDEESVRYLAEIMQHEAGGEGLNGWVAVGEVVMNRVHSDLFPDTVKEVLLQDDQFTTQNELDRMNPTDEIYFVARAVYRGRISILGNENVYYFRNPMITSGISASDHVDWDSHKWYTSIGHHAFYLQ